MQTINIVEEIEKLPLGTTLYRPTKTNIEWWYYGGINPKSPKAYNANIIRQCS